MSNLLLQRCYPILILMGILGLVPFSNFLNDRWKVNKIFTVWTSVIYMLCANTFYLYVSYREIAPAIFRMMSYYCDFNCYIINIKVVLYVIQGVVQIYSLLRNTNQMKYFWDMWYQFQGQYEEVVGIELHLVWDKVFTATFIAVLSTPLLTGWFSYVQRTDRNWRGWLFYNLIISSISIGTSYWLLLTFYLKQTVELVRCFHRDVILSSWTTNPQTIKEIYRLWFSLFRLIKSMYKAMLDLAFVYAMVFPLIGLFMFVDIVLNIFPFAGPTYEHLTVIDISVLLLEFTFWTVIIAFYAVEYSCALMLEANDQLNHMIVQTPLNGKSRFIRQQAEEFLLIVSNRKIDLNFYGFAVETRTFTFSLIPYFIIIMQPKLDRSKEDRRISYNVAANYTNGLL